MPRLTDCVGAVHHWLDTNGLSLNPDKTEAIVIGTGARQRVEAPITSVDIGTVSVQTTRHVKSLGVIIDDSLSSTPHVDSVCKSSYFNFRALRHIRKWITIDTAKTRMPVRHLSEDSITAACAEFARTHCRRPAPTRPHHTCAR